MCHSAAAAPVSLNHYQSALQAPLPGRASYMDLVAGLHRRGIGLSVITGGVQPHKWLVLAALKVAEVRSGSQSGQQCMFEVVVANYSSATSAAARSPQKWLLLAALKGAEVKVVSASSSSTWPFEQPSSVAVCAAPQCMPQLLTLVMVSNSLQGPAAEDAAAAAAPGARHTELFKAMAAGAGQDSTALISTAWPHAARLLQVTHNAKNHTQHGD